MGLLSTLFGNTKEEGKSEIPWVPLNNTEQLNVIEEESVKRPQVIFKHSTTCGVSSMVLKMFKSAYDLTDGQMDFHFLDLHANREVSNEVASKFGIQHQSPQLLIIKNGVVVKHGSHAAISVIKLEQYL